MAAAGDGRVLASPRPAHRVVGVLKVCQWGSASCQDAPNFRHGKRCKGAGSVSADPFSVPAAGAMAARRALASTARVTCPGGEHVRVQTQGAEGMAGERCADAADLAQARVRALRGGVPGAEQERLRGAEVELGGDQAVYVFQPVCWIRVLGAWVVCGRGEAPGRRVGVESKPSCQELPRVCLPSRRRSVHLHPVFPRP